MTSRAFCSLTLSRAPKLKDHNLTAPSTRPKPSPMPKARVTLRSLAFGAHHDRRQAPAKPRQGARKPSRHLGPCCGHRSRCGRFAVGDQARELLRLIPQAALTKPGCNRLLQLSQKYYILRKFRYFLKIRLFSFKSCHLFKCRSTLT